VIRERSMYIKSSCMNVPPDNKSYVDRMTASVATLPDPRATANQRA